MKVVQKPAADARVVVHNYFTPGCRPLAGSADRHIISGLPLDVAALFSAPGRRHG